MLIYLLRNRINGMGYVGQTTMSLEERWRFHLYQDLIVDEAIRECGSENFERIVLIEDITNLPELGRLEVQQIQVQGTLTPNGYNQTPGGNDPPNPTGRTASDKTRAKMSAYASNRSEEHQRKLAEGQRGNKRGLGHHLSSEARAKISVAMKTRKISSETRVRMSNSAKKRKTG